MAVIICRRWSAEIDVTFFEWAHIRQVAREAHPAFVENDWTYGWHDPHVPDVDELARAIVGLWRAVKTSPYMTTYSRSGRFKVRKDDGIISAELEPF